jgi:hypothetical protein
LSDMKKGVAPRTDTKKTCVLKEIGIHAKTKITIHSSIVNIIGERTHDHLMVRFLSVFQKL